MLSTAFTGLDWFVIDEHWLADQPPIIIPLPELVADIPRLHIHLHHHTFATNYLIGGGDSLILQRILGHESLEMTRRYIDQVASHN